MDFKAAKKYCLAKPEAFEDYPFGPDTMVLKIHNKMFATLVENNGVAFTNLKCDPDEALALRDIFPAVAPGYHMNKKHWNTVTLNGSMPTGEIERMIDNSFALVVRSLSKAERTSLEVTYGCDALSL